MAKTVIASLDSGVHQLISHWLTTHACVEPYVISTHRELSIVSPVSLALELLPPFRHTSVFRIHKMKRCQTTPWVSRASPLTPHCR